MSPWGKRENSHLEAKENPGKNCLAYIHRATSCVWVDDYSSSFACNFFERSFKACVMTNQNHAAPLSRGFWLMHDRVSLVLLTLQTTICLGKDDFFRYQSREITSKKSFKLTCCNCWSSSSLSPPTPGPWERKDTAKRKKVRTWLLSVEIRSVATAIAASLAENLSKVDVEELSFYWRSSSYFEHSSHPAWIDERSLGVKSWVMYLLKKCEAEP